MTTATLDETAIAHRYADLGDVRLHYVEAGTGPLVLLLHGFPEFWYSWRRQISALAAAGFHAVAPDMRGYNLSDKPRGVRAYDPLHLTRDVERLIRACGEERAAVVGHDWGAAVAWMFAMRFPDRLSRLAILNVPHPARFMTGILKPSQLLRSSYIFFFQLPWLPEAIIRSRDFALLRRTFKSDPTRPDAFTDEDIDRYVEAMAQPGAVSGGVNYYRALLRQRPAESRRRIRRIDAPTLVIWGERDRYLGLHLAAPDPKWVPNLRVVRLPNASHWVQVDEPERVNELLLDFLTPLKD
jgi:pimeloyl-ACP methyl ester carboxylesterase